MTVHPSKRVSADEPIVIDAEVLEKFSAGENDTSGTCDRPLSGEAEGRADHRSGEGRDKSALPEASRQALGILQPCRECGAQFVRRSEPMLCPLCGTPWEPK